MSRRIALFGGAFDPFHNGHLAICRTALEQLKPDKLIVIPTGTPPHKSGLAASFEDRYAMARLALSGLDCEVSRYEYERGRTSYSAETVEAFRSLYPDSELFFIIGADSYRDINKWYQPWRITACALLAVFPRDGVDAEPAPPAVALNTGKINVSSTMVRTLLERGKSVEPLVPAAVCRYISEHSLYRQN